MSRRETNYNCSVCDAPIQRHEAQSLDMMCTPCYTQKETEKNQEMFKPRTLNCQIAFLDELSKLEKHLDHKSFGLSTPDVLVVEPHLRL